MRRAFVAGNWKMHTNARETCQLIGDLYNNIVDVNIDVAICPPFVNLAAAAEVVKECEQRKHLNIKIGAQNMHWQEKGAFTGEISGSMLKEVGCTYVILGHSERRTLFAESNENVSKKALCALQTGLLPIICIGETLAEREQGITEKVIESQLTGSLAGLSPSQVETCTLAYEPVWAIGTGKTASPEMAQHVHLFIRKFLSKEYGDTVAASIRIQYGGSVKAENIAELINQADIDGALVGGASLEAASFAAIVHACNK